jgi:catechol 2,3-dioxygenase-like lactoylglutathione lyase family enzyme
MIVKYLHTAFEVDDLDEAIVLYQSLGYSLKKRLEKPEPHAFFAHIVDPMGNTFEIWQFIDTAHPQVEFIRRHIAFESDDLVVDLSMLTAKGFTEVIPITKGVSMTYAFVRDPSGNYIEIGQR